VNSLGTFAVAYNEAPGSSLLPQAHTLDQNYPNPFNPVTAIEYALREPAHALLRIYDVGGREVATLVDENQIEGRYRVSWDGRGRAGNAAASGVYFCRLSVVLEGRTVFSSTRKMVLAR